VKYNKNIIIKPHEDLTGLDKAWLSGFIDSEGCFTVSIIKHSAQRKNAQIQVRFVISQKDATQTLSKLAGYLGGTVTKVNSKGYISENMCVNLTNLSHIIEYLKTHTLKTKKQKSLEVWLQIYELVISKKHLDNTEVVDQIRVLIPLINPDFKKRVFEPKNQYTSKKSSEINTN